MPEELNDLQRLEPAAGLAGAPSPAAQPAPQTDRPTEQLETDVYAELNGLPEADEQTLKQFKTLAKELKLAPQAAKRLADWQREVALGQRESGEAERGRIIDSWTQQSKALFGAGYEAEIDRARRAVDAFGGSELRELLDATGLGSHPAVVKAFHQIGKRVSEDESAFGASAGGRDKTFAEALYGK